MNYILRNFRNYECDYDRVDGRVSKTELAEIDVYMGLILGYVTRKIYCNHGNGDWRFLYSGESCGCFLGYMKDAWLARKAAGLDPNTNTEENDMALRFMFNVLWISVCVIVCLWSSFLVYLFLRH